MWYYKGSVEEASAIDIDRLRTTYDGGVPDTIILDLLALCPPIILRNTLRKQLAAFVLSQVTHAQPLHYLALSWRATGLLTQDHQIPLHALGRASFALMQHIIKEHPQNDNLLAGYVNALTPNQNVLNAIVTTDRISGLVATINALRNTEAGVPPVRIIVITPSPFIPDFGNLGLTPLLKMIDLTFAPQDIVDPAAWHSAPDQVTPYNVDFWHTAGYNRGTTLALFRDPYLAQNAHRAGLPTFFLARDMYSLADLPAHPLPVAILEARSMTPESLQTQADPLVTLLDRLYGIATEESPALPAAHTVRAQVLTCLKAA